MLGVSAREPPKRGGHSQGTQGPGADGLQELLILRLGGAPPSWRVAGMWMNGGSLCHPSICPSAAHLAGTSGMEWLLGIRVIVIVSVQWTRSCPEFPHLHSSAL